MVDSLRIYTSDLPFEKNFPTLPSFNSWKTHFKTEVCSGSGHPLAPTPWLRELEQALSVDDLQTSFFITGTSYTDFETLDAKIATAFRRILPGSNFRKIFFEEQKTIDNHTFVMIF